MMHLQGSNLCPLLRVKCVLLLHSILIGLIPTYHVEKKIILERLLKEIHIIILIKIVKNVNYLDKLIPKDR